MREWQALPQRVHANWFSGLDTVCFFSSFFFLLALVFLSSDCRQPCFVSNLHLLRSDVVVWRFAGSMLQSLRSLLQMSLNRRLGLPVGLAPDASSPNKRSFGIRPSSILQMWPSQRSRFCFKMHPILLAPALSRMSSFLMRSCHVIPSRRLRHRM